MWRAILGAGKVALGVGRSAMGGGGLYFVLGAFALGSLPSLWLGIQLISANHDLAECQEQRADAEQARGDFLVDEMNRLNTEARSTANALRQAREGSNETRAAINSASIDCDLEPVRGELQQRLDTVSAARETAASGGTE